MKPYYLVYRVGDRGTRIKYATLEAAHQEAERLAGKHPGDSFEILQCLGVTRTTTPQTFWMDGVIPPHVCEFYPLFDGKCTVCGKHIGGGAEP